MQVCSTDKDEPKGIIIDESYTEESESECVQKIVRKEKYADNEGDYEEYSVMYDPVFLTYSNVVEKLAQD